MNEALQHKLHDLTLRARAILTQETLDLLQGVHGLRPNGTFEPIVNLPAALGNDEARETRARLEHHMRDEIAAGRSGEEAVAHLAREAAFTHLNRLVAFKLLEARKLLPGTIDRHHDSRGFLFYVNDNPAEYALYEAGTLPQDVLGEGPRDKAYRHFLLGQCADLAKEVRVLFDAGNLPSCLFPRPRALKTLVDLLNAPDVAEAWLPGNEETVGWVYQYFNEPDLEIFHVDKALKVPPELIAARSQQFTPRWIIEYLVQNTLGRHWLQMHPDSHLAEHTPYLVPLACVAPAVPLKQVREITILDPASGTMHFGLVAFDLLAAMYEEEMVKAGNDGWPDQPSVQYTEDIPAAILAHNLHGIDIDLRAVQLAALALYIKSKSYNSNAKITDHNLVCADIRLLNGKPLSAFLDKVKFARPVYERVIRGFWGHLKDATQLGSLLRVDESIRELIATEQRNQRIDAPLLNQQLFSDAYMGSEDFWDVLDRDVLQAFDDYARSQSVAGSDENYFIGESVKGFRLLTVLMGHYDVIVTNPPYLDSRDANTILREYLEVHYPETKRNLYSAFLERCTELLAPNGRFGIVTPQTFMFITSFEALRNQLLSSYAVESLVHTGSNTFPDATVDCALYVLRHEPNAIFRREAQGIYFRTLQGRTPSDKREQLERALSSLLDSHPANNIYICPQDRYKLIPDKPWVYWLDKRMGQLFEEMQLLGNIAAPRQGIATADNFRFVRYWWEIGRLSIALNCASHEESRTRVERWYPYMKGGGYRKWYGNQQFVLNWWRDGTELRANRPISVIRNPDYFFQRGITYSLIGLNQFSARLSPGGFIFDVGGSCIFPNNVPLIMASLNSSVANYLLSVINPTVNFQVGDLARLPIPNESSPRLNELVEQAIALAKQDSIESETTYDFIAPPAWHTGIDSMARRRSELLRIEQDIDDEVYRLYGITDEDRASIEDELAEPMLNNTDEPGDIQATDVAESETEESATTLSRETLAQQWVSYAVGIVLGRFQPGIDGALGRGNFTAEIATQLRALGDTDGIVALDESHPDDLGRKVRRALELMAGDEEAEQIIAIATGGKRLDDWLAREFFKQHAQQYHKRPIYWLLQSPHKSYSLIAFHERLTADSLPLIAGNRYVRGKLNELDTHITELDSRAKAIPASRERRAIEKQLVDLREGHTDVEEFLQRLVKVINATNEHGETVGWCPELDDGVLINLAPLRKLLPSWSTEPTKCWNVLVRGDYDWSHTAMRYWPERVLAKCMQNKSYAIAHGLA